jgi:hypothetical protein
VTSRTPGAFRTKVITHGVDPQISCYYRAAGGEPGHDARRVLVVGDEVQQGQHEHRHRAGEVQHSPGPVDQQVRVAHVAVQPGTGLRAGPGVG